MRRSLLLGCALLFTTSVARAEDKPKSDEVSKDVVQKIIKRWKDTKSCPAGAEQCYREDLPDALSNQVRTGKVTAKDKPLAVGETAPRFDGLPTQRPVAVVFYRGHW
jgi:hypothetical protein